MLAIKKKEDLNVAVKETVNFHFKPHVREQVCSKTPAKKRPYLTIFYGNWVGI
jgi:hypothetical protein